MKLIKLLALSALLFSLETFASVGDIHCINPKESNLTYTLKELKNDDYSLTVSKKTLVPYSCQSRWGCDYEQKTIAFDTLSFSDVQGAYLFESKKSRIEMEDMDNVSYSYTVKNNQGVFVTKTVTLECK